MNKGRKKSMQLHFSRKGFIERKLTTRGEYMMVLYRTTLKDSTLLLEFFSSRGLPSLCKLIKCRHLTTQTCLPINKLEFSSCEGPDHYFC